MNLEGVAYWSSEHPFLDRFKTSGAWGAYDGTTPVASPVPLDANGYPTHMPDGANMLLAMFEVDPTSAGKDDVYELTYSGKATVSVGGTVLSASDGKIVFRIDSDNGMDMLELTNIDPAHPVTDIHVVRQDQVALYNQGQLFNPDFLSKVSGWDTLRFKDWANTDNTDLSSWSQRTTLNSASWSGSTTGKGGVPIEVQVQLANQTHSNMWVNVPAQADDDYVRQMMTYVHDHLDPSLKVTLEYSNEVWNWGYSQAQYALQMGDKLWGTDANGDGKIDPSNPAEHVGDGWLQFYGYRSAQVAEIAKSVFTDSESRLSTLVSTQTAFTGSEQSIFAGVAKAQLGSVGDLFHSYAITTYFGNELDGGNAADQAKVIAWAKEGSAGVDAAFRELEFGDQGFSSHFSLEDLKTIFAYQANIAAENGMSLVAYEGGAHLTSVYYDQSVQPLITQFFTTLDNDPRMGELYAKMAAEFSAAGGTELSAFQDTATPSQYGDWGVLDSSYQDSSPRYDALRAVQDPGALAAVHTAQSSYTLGALEGSVTYTGTGAFAGTGNGFANNLTGGNGGGELHGMDGNDVLVGGTGSDLLDGGTGADHMTGGAGNDTYWVDNVGDVVTERLNGGTDQVVSTLDHYTLPDNVENLSGSGSADFTGTGNALNNVITGGGGANHLYGLGGNDVLQGGSGDDVLDGGIGNDQMSGGAGNDVYYVDARGDVVTEAPDGGIDEIRTTLISYRLGDTLENLTFTGHGFFTGWGNAAANVIQGGDNGNSLYGLDGADTLVGGAGNDLLDGGTGADSMVGGAGNDRYIVDNAGDHVVEAPNGGTDVVLASVSSYALSDNVEQLTFTGHGAFTGWGNAGNNLISGSTDGPNNLYGGDGNDWLVGGSGNDFLDGGSGTDVMVGGAGDDTYVVDQSGDRVTENPQGGTDTVISTADYVLSANVENLCLNGSAVYGTGNNLDNMIVGDDQDNVLTGGVGRDNLVGGAGNDLLDGGTGDDALTGGSGNDRLLGGAGNDQLIGGDGDDIIQGGAGRDIVWGGAGADRFVFQPGDFATAPNSTTPSVLWADVIADFSSAEGDRLDLSALEGTVTGGHRLHFVGTANFSHNAGEIRMDAVNGGYDVTADLNGDGRADLHLIVYSPAPLTAGDFML